MAKASQFLKLVDGEMILGECDNEAFSDWIMVSSWDWSINDPAAIPKKGEGDSSGGAKAPTGGGAGGGRSSTSMAQGERNDKVSPSVFSFSKQTDRSTTRLLGAMDNGVIFSEASLVIVEQFKEAKNPFDLRIKFKNAFLVDFSWRASASGAGRTFDETWKLNYSEISFDYLWRGGEAGHIMGVYVKPADSTETASRKIPTTEAEKQDALKRQWEEWSKASAKKSGK